ncbi:GNAT family N-acetyltransferase [Aliivibrio kagoshimensis]|uniref:GNAT family N-acetyltransferase n=1 Tax=Aliivibrio kagoshimensis TaxID=2910230 RepID=UPI003D122643
MTFFIETERLILRNVNEHDEEAYIQLSQDAKYQRFYDEDDCSIEKASQLVEMFIEQSKEQPRTKYNLAITHKQSGEFIDVCGLRIEGNRQASVGCGLAREYQVSGYAQEAMQALIDYGFNQLHVHRIYAETIADNRAAILLCKRLGMRIEGRFFEHRYFKEQWWDTVILAMLKQDKSLNNQLNS